MTPYYKQLTAASLRFSKVGLFLSFLVLIVLNLSIFLTFPPSFLGDKIFTFSTRRQIDRRQHGYGGHNPSTSSPLTHSLYTRTKTNDDNINTLSFHIPHSFSLIQPLIPPVDLYQPSPWSQQIQLHWRRPQRRISSKFDSSNSLQPTQWRSWK